MISQNILLADVKSDMYSNAFPDGWLAVLMGESTRNDTPARYYQYNGSSTATDDGESVLKPTNVTGAGRWLKEEDQQLQADWNQTTSTALDYIKNKPTLSSAPTSAVVSRTLNTSFIPTSTNGTYGYYSISISVTSTLLGTNSGTVLLQISPDNTTFTTVAEAGLSLSGVASTVINTHVISGFIPATYHIKLTTSIAGTNGATITYITGHEVSI